MECNKKVNSHTDLRYLDDGVQSIDNSADPQLPTVTLTVGMARTITFEQMTKVVSGGQCVLTWSKTDPEYFV